MPAPQKRRPTPIKSLVGAVLQDIHARRTLSEEEVRDLWGQVAGELRGRHSEPTSLAKAVLRVVVDNPGWMQELMIQKRGILKDLQKRLGKETIQDIKFRIGVLDSRC